MNISKTVQTENYSRTMLFIVFSYAFFGIAFSHLANILLGLILVGTLPLFILHKRTILQNPLFWVALLTLLVEILSWINSLIYVPEFASSGPKLDRLAKLYLFFFIAYWLKGELKNVVYLWALFIFGFIFTILINNDLSLLLEIALNNQRVDLSIKNSQWDSMLAGTALLISIIFTYLTVKSKLSRKLKISSLILLSFLILLFSTLVLVTQSRQIWLALFILTIVGPLTYITLHNLNRLKIGAISLLTISALFLLLSNNEIIQNRIAKEQSSIDAVLEQKHSIEMSSIGIRVNSWLDAKEWILRHPILGLDSAAIPQVIQQSQRFDESLKKQFGHLHNFFIETLVAYGLIGFLLILAIYYYILKSISLTSLKRDEKKLYLLAAICFTTYWLIINNFETFNSRSLGIFTHNIIFAGFYTFYITSSMKSDKE